MIKKPKERRATRRALPNLRPMPPRSSGTSAKALATPGTEGAIMYVSGSETDPARMLLEPGTAKMALATVAIQWRQAQHHHELQDLRDAAVAAIRAYLEAHTMKELKAPGDPRDRAEPVITEGLVATLNAIAATEHAAGRDPMAAIKAVLESQPKVPPPAPTMSLSHPRTRQSTGHMLNYWIAILEGQLCPTPAPTVDRRDLFVAQFEAMVDDETLVTAMGPDVGVRDAVAGVPAKDNDIRQAALGRLRTARSRRKASKR